MLAMITISAMCLTSCGPKDDGNAVTSAPEGASTTEAVTTPPATTEKSQTPPTPWDAKTYRLTSTTEGVKLLGVRHLAVDGMLTCDWTGSGLEMDVIHEGGDIVFHASATDNCYFRVYVDGEEWKNGETVYFTVGTMRSSIALDNVPAGEHRIRLVKVTGYTLARSQIHDVVFCGTIKPQAPADNDLYIEFVGDSISCGWGNIGGHTGVYTDQDGTLAYPLMLAEALQADYSVTALSGKGLIYGNPEMTSGYRYGSILRSKAAEYSFSRQADMVVINIGTNDYSKRTSNDISEAAFKASYLAFLKTVAEKNGNDCKIFCLYNTMNDTFANAIIAAVAEFGGTAKNVYLVKMQRTVSGHPTLAEHETYFNALLPILKLEKLPEDPKDVPVIPDDTTPNTPPSDPPVVDPLPPVENPTGKLELTEGEGESVGYDSSEWSQ